jgi:hypothetical protein
MHKMGGGKINFVAHQIKKYHQKKVLIYNFPGFCTNFHVLKLQERKKNVFRENLLNKQIS